MYEQVFSPARGDRRCAGDGTFIAEDRASTAVRARIRTAPSLRAKGVTMDRETEAAPRQATPADGLPPIFQRPTYPSGEPATRAPERAPDEPRESRQAARETEPTRGSSAASRSVRGAEPAWTPRRRPRRRRPAPPKTDDDGAPAEAGGSDDPQAPRRRSRGGRGRGGRGRGGSTGSARDETRTDARRPGRRPHGPTVPRTGSRAARAHAEGGAGAAPP